LEDAGVTGLTGATGVTAAAGAARWLADAGPRADGGLDGTKG
jgi:hypothetical protein